MLGWLVLQSGNGVLELKSIFNMFLENSSYTLKVDNAPRKNIGIQHNATRYCS
jgi:hypothetical protein